MREIATDRKAGFSGITPGFQVLHGNHLEDLRDLVADWIIRNPLQPLETETILVQSNGISQWLKLALAARGVAMGLEITLPARFQWRLYRSLPGGDDIPRHSPYDTERLLWRVMQLLPRLQDEPEFSVLRPFLAPQEPEGYTHRCYQLALRTADLFDQYQIYRSDWLAAWAAETLAFETLDETAMRHQRWQQKLWSLLVREMPREYRELDRGSIHARSLSSLAGTARSGGVPPGVPRRVIVFGISSLAPQLVEVLRYISPFSQVLVCVHNPCRYHWADIVTGRDYSARLQRRSNKPGLPGNGRDEDLLHLHAHPLLAAWGMQGRDYIGMLDEVSDAESHTEDVHVFRSPGSDTILHRLQEDIFELRSVAESRTCRGTQSRADRAGNDPSLVFHIAHSALREVEILHDQLLDAFERDPDLRPRDVMVMVPDVTQYAPLITAVFGRIDHEDPRYIPFTVSDQGRSQTDTLVGTVRTLLSLPTARLTVDEVLTLLDTPALRRKFEISRDELDLLPEIIASAGIRWGLDGAHRQQFDMPAGVEQNTWRFGLRRLLLGYATGDEDVWKETVALAGVSMGDADLIGRFFALVDRLDSFRGELTRSREPREWTDLLRSLLDGFFLFSHRNETATEEHLLRSLQNLEDACSAAQFTETIPVSVVQDAWLAGIDAPRLTQRFLAGAVNFATLLPMRAIPFRMICLLGMNDGDYPRQSPPLGFDLTNRPDGFRPGDRSRREDDRYLFLEALLSARRRLYISWVGFSISDNSARPPSVLVGQLRDHLNRLGVNIESMTTRHPLQPFSLEYYRREGPLFTYVSEWRLNIEDPHGSKRENAGLTGDPHGSKRENAGPGPDTRNGPVDREVGLSDLRALLKNPVRLYFKEHLNVQFESSREELPRQEPFAPDSLESWNLRNQLLQDAYADPEASPEELIDRIALAGNVPVPPFDRAVIAEVLADTEDVLRRYREAIRDRVAVKPEVCSIRVRGSSGAVILMDEVIDIFEHSDGTMRRTFLSASRVHDGKGSYRWEKLLAWWPSHLAAQLSGRAVLTEIASLHGTVTLPPVAEERARPILEGLVDEWERAVGTPCRVTPGVGCAWIVERSELRDGEDRMQQAGKTARSALLGGFNRRGEYEENPYLMRAWPDPEEILTSEETFREATALYGDLVELLR